MIGGRGSAGKDGCSPAVLLWLAATMGHSTAAVGGSAPARHGAAEQRRSYPYLTRSPCSDIAQASEDSTAFHAARLSSVAY